MKTMKILVMTIICLMIGATSVSSQKLKDRLKSKIPKKDKSEMWECGYVHKKTLREKASLTNMMIKGGGRGSNTDMGTAAISIYYQANLHPQNIVRYPTDIPGWETCGDAVFAGFTNKAGAGVSSIDGPFMIGDKEVELAGMGTYFHGFKSSERGTKTVKLSTTNGDKIEVEVKPGVPLEIKTVDGKTKDEELVIDGTKDIVIELANGDADPNSQLHVQMVCKLVGTPIIYDVIVTKASNTITIPKEAFKNFEGSPSPFMKKGALIVNRVTETIIEGTDAGALRTLSAYMDWRPVTVEGDIAKGNALTMGFDSSKNTQIDIELRAKGTYNYTARKAGPYTAPPVAVASDVAVASFVIRGNLVDQTTEQVVVFEDGKLKEGTLTKTSNFPAVLNSTKTWFDLSNSMYEQLAEQLNSEMGWRVRPLKEITTAAAYKHAKSIKNTANNTLVEVGAGGSKRILTTSSDDIFKDLSITFPGDFVSERLVKELGVNMVLAITIDLNMNAKTQSLDTKVYITAFAPNVSYKTAAQYFTMSGTVKGISFKEDEKYSGAAHEKVYEMIQGEALINGFINAMKELSEKEKDYPVYEKLWKAKL